MDTHLPERFTHVHFSDTAVEDLLRSGQSNPAGASG
jgi:hypothetical protein